MTAYILSIGDELLIGQVINTNAAWLGERLNEVGFKVVEVVAIADDHELIIKKLQEASEIADLVLMTGGLGPTKDDITKVAIADYYKVGMTFSQETWDRIQKIFSRLGRPTTPAHKQQCYMPANAELLYNKKGSAPGMWFEQNGTIMVSMPGVPYEMKYIMENGVLPRLIGGYSSRTFLYRTIRTAGTGESHLAQLLEQFEDNLPENMKLAFLPNVGEVRLRLTIEGDDQAETEQLLSQKVDELVATIPEYVYGYDKDLLEQAIGILLKENGLMLGTAESCTGGTVAQRITSIPGSSAYFKGSIVAYSNDVKEYRLGVQKATLVNHGAVSEPTVQEMVKGIIQALKVDIGIATSGIAGPGGGTKEKPVGTIWIAVGNKEKVVTHKLQLGKDRLMNIKYTSSYALNMVRKFLLAQYLP